MHVAVEPVAEAAGVLQSKLEAEMAVAAPVSKRVKVKVTAAETVEMVEVMAAAVEGAAAASPRAPR